MSTETQNVATVQRPQMTTPDSAPVVEQKKPEAAAEDPFAGFVTKSFTDGKEDAAPGQDEVDEAESEHEEVSETEAGDEDDTGEAGDIEEDADEAEASQEPKRRAENESVPLKTFKREVRNLRERSRADRAENAQLRQRIAELERGAQPAKEPAKEPAKGDLTDKSKKGKSQDGRPNPDDYEFGQLDDRFVSDLADWTVDQRLAAREQAEKDRRSQEAAEQDAQKFESEAMTLMEKGLEKHGDEFDRLVVQGAQNNKFALSEHLGKLCGASEHGADIVLHLARNPKEALKVYRLSPLEQAAYFGRMEARFSGPSSDKAEKKQAQAPKAPPPVKPARGSGGKFSVSADTGDFAAFERMANGKG